MIATSAWRARGKTVDTRDGRVFVVDTPAREAVDDHPVLLLHGFPTSSWDFAEPIERIARRRRVIAFDFIGFGFSDKPPAFGYSLFEQTDVALAIARDAGVSRAHVWAHDMGTSVATEMLARRARGLVDLDLASLTLTNGSVHIELAHPTKGQRILKSRLGPLFVKLNTKRTFQAQLRRVFAKPPSQEELDAMWELASRDDGIARFVAIIQYIAERKRFHRRWIGALETCGVPALVAWGRRDKVAVVAIAEQLAKEIPGAKLVVWDDLGHYPQVEDPERVTKAVIDFWDELLTARRR